MKTHCYLFNHHFGYLWNLEWMETLVPILRHTFPEANIAPENRPKETRIPTIHFQGREMLVSGSVAFSGIFFFWNQQTGMSWWSEVFFRLPQPWSFPSRRPGNHPPHSGLWPAIPTVPISSACDILNASSTVAAFALLQGCDDYEVHLHENPSYLVRSWGNVRETQLDRLARSKRTNEVVECGWACQWRSSLVSRNFWLWKHHVGVRFQ